jgi:predicted nucleic acid-binding protein
MPDLLDASVWLPLSAPDHVHYPRARRYWDDEAASELAFCRVTALALLRHLSNPRILGEAALDGGAAWRALETWLALPLALSCQPSAFQQTSVFPPVLLTADG